MLRRLLASAFLLALAWMLVGETTLAHAATVTVTDRFDEAAVNGRVSLREAITSINRGANVNVDVVAVGVYGVNDAIHFNVPGGGVRILSFQGPGGEPFPHINRAVTIDGFTQPGASPNTLPRGDNAIVLIELFSAGSGFKFFIDADNVTIRGLSIHGALAANIRVNGGTGVTIAGNRIGLRANGETIASFSEVGVQVAAPGVVTIGGPAPGDRNVISGNRVGISIGTQADGTGKVILNNYIGTNAAGTTTRGNANGIIVSSKLPVQIGRPGIGNVISGNLLAGMILESGAVIQGNRIGTNADGSAPLPNQFGGIRIDSSSFGAGGSPHALIGTDGDGINDEAEGNLISGNGQFGIFCCSFLNPLNPNAPVIAGNRIGTNAAGDAAIPNTLRGIEWNAGSQGAARIGGSGAAAGNLISGNTGPGIDLAGLSGTIAGDLAILNNRIGTDAAGISPLPNTGPGIRIQGQARAVIGGSGPSDGNTIRHNGGAGVAITSSVSVPILGNRIDQNTGLGIDLGTPGVTVNDASDADVGPNGLQNFPVLTTASSSNVSSVVVGTLSTTANTPVRIELFASSSCDSTGHGEGGRLLGGTQLTTDGAGNAAFTLTGLPALAPGEVVTATATNTTLRQTSEFSKCAVPSALGGLAVTPVSLSEGTGGTGTLHLPVTLTQAGIVPATVQFQTSDNGATGGASCATPGVDYLHTQGTLTFNPGETLKNVPVTICGDGLVEPTEHFLLTLSNATNAGIATSTERGTILDDDLAGLAVSDATVSESNTGRTSLTFLVTLGAASSQPVTVTARAESQTAREPDDFQPFLQTLVFQPGEISKAVSVIVEGDTLAEGDEQLQMRLVDPINALITRAVGIGTIIDDDVPTSTPTVTTPTTIAELAPAAFVRDRAKPKRINNAGNRNEGDHRAEGRVIQVRLGAGPPEIEIEGIDGVIVLRLRGEAGKLAEHIRINEYVVAEGDKVHEQLYDIDELEVDE